MRRRLGITLFGMTPALLLAFAGTLFSQTLGTRAGAIYYPGDPTAGEIKMAVGLSSGKPPDAAVEEASEIRWPIFEFLITYGLPENFQLSGKVSTEIVTNHVAAGARWTYDAHPLAFAVGYDFAVLFGRLEQYGFNNSVFGTISYPNLQAGYDFTGFTLTLRGELNIVNSISSSTDGIELSTDSRQFNGGAVALYLEQPLWKDNYFTMGFKANFIKFYYPTWLLFPTWNRYFFVPELVLGLRI
jgi:hypothetical protein